MDDDFREQIYKQIDTGRFLLTQRTERNLTQPKVAKALGISPSYLSEVEKGVKMPSEQLIVEFAKYYKLDEDELFQKYGKVPLHAQKEIQDTPYLQKALSDLGRLRKKGKIKDEEFDDLQKEVIAVYRDFLDKKKGE